MTSEFNTKIADYWPTANGYDPAKRTPMCEQYERQLVQVLAVFLASEQSSHRLNETVSLTLRRLSTHIHSQYGLDLNQFDGLEWDDIEFDLYNAVDRALNYGAGPYELAASTKAAAILVEQGGVDGLVEETNRRNAPMENLS